MSPGQRRAARPTVTRKIYFFRADAGSDDGGQPIPYDPTPALQRIQGLPFTQGADGNCWDGADESVTCCWVDSTEAPQRLRLGNVRRRYLPRVEEGGVLSDLQIPPSSGIAEEIHVVFFPNNIVGSEFNFYGPRISRLRRYLAAKTANVAVVPYFEPLLRRGQRGAVPCKPELPRWQMRHPARATNSRQPCSAAACRVALHGVSMLRRREGAKSARRERVARRATPKSALRRDIHSHRCDVVFSIGSDEGSSVLAEGEK